jgi:hypothetical protein
MSMVGPGNILVITWWDRHDPLVENYVLPYLRIMARVLPAGSILHLVTLDKPGTPVRPSAGEEGFVHHAYRYHGGGLSGLAMVASVVWSLTRLVRRADIRTVHAWCTPAGMLGYLVSVLTGRPLVVDSFEPHAEAMVENGSWKRGGLAFRTLFLFERLQTRRAKAVVAANEGMRAYARRVYGHVPAQFLVKPACVDLERFSVRNVKRPELLRAMGLEDKLVAVYAGKFGGIYLDEEVFDLLKVARDHWGDRLHVLLLTAHAREELLPYMRRADLDPGLFTVRSALPSEVPDLMGLADWALTPRAAGAHQALLHAPSRTGSIGPWAFL